MFTLAHLSDPHLGPMPDPRIRELLSKRVIGYVNWQRNRGRSMRSTYLDQLVGDVHSHAPDHIAVTGDLVNIALDREITAARDWLERIGPSDDVTVVPGNHDAYVPGAIRKATDAWASYMTGDGETEVGFPFVRRRGPVALVGVSTARASGPWFATGRIGTEQTRRLHPVLKQLGEEGLFRILLIHHPPGVKATAWVKRLTDASRVRAAIKAGGCELVLHGHTHMATQAAIEGPNGDVPVICVPSASNVPGGRRPPSRYNLFRISGEPGSWRCGMVERGFTEKDGAIETLDEFDIDVPSMDYPRAASVS
ncbi:metallophosphoesterase [Stappia sp. GBMRC 2046]|uniref:Metallophosphoesterase n=1 Tax=Stappia sediminis TaxID=2692190 RepID=A0A7X3S5J5_9HYPH|nr:metallophosphoesterase [Stappia sediminis]MXN63299.1 metallophosphoesterase [Stappia sediminis]